MPKEKYNLMVELKQKKDELRGKKKLSMIGQGDFPGSNNVMRSTMNIKHQSQRLTIDKPEFPYVYDGKENVTGAHSSFYTKTDKPYQVIAIVKKYNERLKGKCNIALYFLYCKEDDSYKLEERKEVENLTENFGFDYKNEYLDNAEVGEYIPKGTVLKSSTSYDEDGNVSMGVNGRILFGTHPAVQDDAIIISKSFAERMISNQVTPKTIPINENTILLNLYGKNGEYQGLPNIGDIVTNGILAATRNVKETRMFSDLRDSSLSTINLQSDQVFYGDGEVVDINVYCNNPNIKTNKVNKQLIEYYNDARWFYTEVYKNCKKIINSGSKVDKEINRWMRKAMDYLDTQAIWAFNDNTFSNLMVEIVIRKKEPIKIGRKIVGRSGNKTVTSTIWADEDMPYLTTDAYRDQYGVVHPKGEIIRTELISNPLAIINRTIPMALFEPSITFILDKTRQHMKTLDHLDDQRDFMFNIIRIFNPIQAKDLRVIYDDLSNREKKKFIESAIEDGIFIRWEAFSDAISLRDSIIEIYKTYGDIIKPYNIFMPKPKWGRDIYIGQDCIGFQYMLLLKQSGERGFSVRSAGAISDESLPEKSHENKIGKLWHSETPIRFGEYETPNFMIITEPTDFALVTALYRSSIDGRKFMYEAILSEDGEYEIPDKFTSRSAEIFQVYLKSLGVRMETIINDDEFIGEPEHDNEVIAYNIRNRVIFCTPNEMYYLKKLSKLYKYYIKDNPGDIDDIDEVWDFIMENLPFKKKYLTDTIIDLFKNNLEVFSN
jgi:hypothetical protein